MALKCTPYPIKTATGSAQVQTCVDVSRSNSPYIADKNGNVLYIWDVSSKTWMGQGGSSETINRDGFSSTETYGSILTQNNKTFTDNTIKIINDQLKGSPVSAQTYRNSGAFRPWNQWTITTASTPSSGSNVGVGATPSAPPFDVNQVNSATSSLKTSYRKNYPGNLNYPLNFENQDYIKFTMKYFRRKKLSEPDKGFRLEETTDVDEKGNQIEDINGVVKLGIQPTISDENMVDWQQDDLNAFRFGAALTSLGLATGDFDNLGKRIEAEVTDENFKNFLQSFLAQESANAKGLFTRLSGGILNPNIELLFNAPSLRTFNFSFNLSPRSKKESETVQQIIRFFKQGMAVKRTATSFFLASPNTFDIEYHLWKRNGDTVIDIPHPYLNKFKKCALTRCTVNYTPTNSYMTFEQDGGMVSYELNLTFQELEPVFEGDYRFTDEKDATDAVTNQIGY